MANLYHVDSPINRDQRNNVNATFEDIQSEIGKVVIKTGQIKDAVDGSLEGLQTQIDTLVVEGDSSPEAAQARVDEDNVTYNTLKERLDTQNIKLKENINSLAVISDNFPRLSGESDDTLRLQRALDSLSDGDTLVITPGVYEVSKNNSLSGFPSNDQPCLYLYNKKDIKISGYGATLKVNNHAQGIFEARKTDNLTVEGLKLEGYGEFVPLDGTTGRGEKGYNTGGGYNTSTFWGFKKNNSYDTSTITKGGVPWGTFGSGFIGNSAFGFLLLESSNVNFFKCESKGFNYAGFGVGYWGYPEADSKCYDVTFNKCISTDNYQSNFYVCDCDSYLINDCISERSGHPDAQPLTDTVADPGYGFMCTGITNRIPKNIKVTNSKFTNHVRKGIDFHAGQNIHVLDNYVEDCYACGIFASYSSPTQYTRDIFIERNTIVRCGIQSLGSIYVSGLYDADYSRANIILNAQILNNIIKDFGYRAMYAPSFDNLRFEGNLIEGYDNRYTGVPRALVFGRENASEISYNGIFSKNTFKGAYPNAIYILRAKETTVEGNNINLNSATSNACIFAPQQTNVLVAKNVITNANGNGYSLAANEGLNNDNLVVSETTRSVSNTKSKLGKREVILLTANGANYTMTRRVDSGIVTAISNVSGAGGFILTLRGDIPQNTIPDVTITGGGDLMTDGTNYIVSPQVVTSNNTELRIKLVSATGTSHALNTLTSGSILIEIKI